MIAIAFLFILPFFIMVIGSVQDLQYFSGDMKSWLPKQMTVKNFQLVLSGNLFFRWFFNSMVISVIPVLTSALISTLLGYIFAKKNFVGKNVVFWLFLSMIMIPSQVLVMPTYIMFTKFNWINTYWVFLIPGLWDITAFFLMKQVIMSLPDSLLEAAKLDGCNELQTFTSVVLPLSKQAIATISVLSFMSNFTNLFYPLIYTSTNRMYTMTVGLASMMTETGGFSFQMAGAVLNFLPTLIIFIALQKYFTQGIAMAGIKG
jgi:multiple sugar transport system permease protein